MSARTLPAGPPADGVADVEVSAPAALAEGFRPYERYDVVLRHDDGSAFRQTRDVLRGGPVVGVLTYDPGRELVVLIRQFRLPAHLATGRGEMVEIVAGRVEPGEDAAQAARRECLEEIGIAPHALLPMLGFLPTPGLTDEAAQLFLGLVDSARLPTRGGAENEVEVTHPFTVSIEDALGALDGGRCVNGYLIIALQWLALNRARLPELLAAAG
ncbi:NUDIX hydrolase [Xanthobacter sp. KR7-225]|uniref:NUDIX hydrolase n=1 Tax=Xanthobacter sp. KR7-225 TaxID=3156613 RepID=UPI0032B400D2